MSASKRVPCLVVSGFLGAGKTTLVRYLLERARDAGERVAVVSNEFGSLGVDAQLFAASPGAYVELEGGCVCCKLADDLVDTLQGLRERVDPDRVIVETSGVALPYDTLINFWRPPVSSWACDEVSVVVVDAEQVLQGRDLQGTFAEQVGSGDILVVNKTDLVADGDLERVRTALRTLEPDAPIVHAAFGRIDPALLFLPERPSAAARAGHATRAEHRHEQFVAGEIRVDTGGDPAELRSRLEALGALRVKGFVRGRDGLLLVQGIGARIEFEPTDLSPPPEAVGRLVVIRKAETAPT